MPDPGQALFGPDVGIRRAAAAVNAAGPPAGLAPHDVPAALAAVLRETGEPGSLTGLEDEAHALAGVLAELFTVFSASEPAAAARLLGAALARHTGPLRLVAEPGAAWHLHAERPGDESWAGWLAASSLVAMAVHFATHGEPAWGICQAGSCRHVYVRTGPGRPRRTCSPRCAARLRQAELRARRR